MESEDEQYCSDSSDGGQQESATEFRQMLKRMADPDEQCHSDASDSSSYSVEYRGYLKRKKKMRTSYGKYDYRINMNRPRVMSPLHQYRYIVPEVDDEFEDNVYLQRSGIFLLDDGTTESDKDSGLITIDPSNTTTTTE